MIIEPFVEALSETVGSDPLCPSDRPQEWANSRRLEALVRGHLPHVYRLLRHLGVLAGDVDDAVQQVFLILCRKLADVEPGSERAFLSSTAVRIASRWRRTHRRRQEDADHELLSQHPAGEPSPEQRLEHAQAERLLLEVLDALPDKLREVFVLFELEELTFRHTEELSPYIGQV